MKQPVVRRLTTILYRFLLIVAAIVFAMGPALALDCGGKTQSCKIATGEYNIAVPAVFSPLRLDH